MAAYFGLGESLAAKSDVRGALVCTLRAADLDPGFVEAQSRPAICCSWRASSTTTAAARGTV